MKPQIVVFIVLVSYVSGQCSILESLKVKNQWADAFGKGNRRVEFGLRLWNSFFQDHPETRDLFKRVRGDNAYSPEFKAHAQRVLSGFDMTVSLLDDPDTFAAQIAHLKKQHDPRNLKKEYFDWFRNHLLEILPEYIGTKLDFEAWTHCFNHISSGISP
uniref:Extracellular globin n=1 Tax=Glossoscolex paulistus TaxID=1046353 RepID=A0A0P4VL51_9ANNE